MALPASNAAAAATWFAEIRGLASPVADGPDQDMYKLALKCQQFSHVLYRASVAVHHLALGVDAPMTPMNPTVRSNGPQSGNHAPEKTLEIVDSTAPASGLNAQPTSGHPPAPPHRACRDGSIARHSPDT